MERGDGPQVFPGARHVQDHGPAETVADGGELGRVHLGHFFRTAGRPRRQSARARWRDHGSLRRQRPGHPRDAWPACPCHTCPERSRRSRPWPGAAPGFCACRLWPHHSCTTSTPGRFPLMESSQARNPLRGVFPCWYSTSWLLTSARTGWATAHSAASAAMMENRLMSSSIFAPSSPCARSRARARANTAAAISVPDKKLQTGPRIGSRLGARCQAMGSSKTAIGSRRMGPQGKIGRRPR